MASPLFLKSFEMGMVTNLNENLLPNGSARLLMNLDADEEIGSAVSRLGTGKVANQLVDGESILGLKDFQDSVGTNHALIATINASGGGSSVVYKVGTGTIRTGLTANKKMHFLVFLDSILMLNGTDAIASYDGSSVITTGGAFDIGNIPASDVTLTEEFLDRVYLAGDVSEPDRLYYSGLQTAGAVSWTSGNGNVDIEPEDGGGKITALSKVPGYLLIFKERSMKRWNFSSAFPESLVDIGTPSQESVVKAAGLCAFFSASSESARGFYITNGARPIPISHDRIRNIKKWVDAIPQSKEANIAGFSNERFFGWEIGDVTVDGVAYTNVVVKWNRILDQWSVRSYPSEFTFFATWVDGGVNKIVGGDDDGTVIELDKANTHTDHDSAADAQVPIFYELQTQEDKMGFNQIKELAQEVYWDTRNALKSKSIIYADGVQINTSIKSDRWSRLLKALFNKPVKGRRFIFSLKGEVQGDRVVIKELEIPQVTVTKSYD